MIKNCIVILLILVILAVIGFYNHRENKLQESIHSMINTAIAGKFKDKTLDETRMSKIENEMWRFLSDHQVSEENLVAKKNKIQQLISDISHQTTTPIANMRLYSQLLEEQIAMLEISDRQTGSKKNMEKQIHVIKEQSDKLDFLIQSLVKLSRMENGIIHVETQKEALQEIISDAAEQIANKAGQKNITFTAGETHEFVLADSKWTAEAICNILDNAVKYTPQGGSINVTVIPYEMFVRIDITDTGIGIAKSEINQIFSRFYRSQDVRKQPGVGIGLYLTREIIQAQKGYIKVTSSYGRGTTFSVFLLKA